MWKVYHKKLFYKNVLITRGAEGLSYIKKTKSIHAPTKKIEVFDVSGAGDTVLSVISVCIANKINIKYSLDLANRSAGIAVGKIGTSTINLNELFKPDQKYNKKIVSLSELTKIVSNYKKNKLKVGFTNGCFDIMHVGHLKYLEKSKTLCDKLIIAINSDNSVKKLKGKGRPINNQLGRLKMLSSFDFCDHVLVFNDPTPIKLIKSLKPDIITKGGDYKEEEVVGFKDVKKWNGIIRVLDYTKGFSTTNIIKKSKLK